MKKMTHVLVMVDHILPAHPTAKSTKLNI